MRKLLPGLIALLLVGSPVLVAHAKDDDTTARLREQLHRTQEALRQAQADGADLTRAKLDAEQKLQAASKQIDSAKSTSKSAQVAKASLQAQVEALQNARMDLEHKLEEANDRLAVTTSKLGETFKQLGAKDAELTQTKQSLEQSVKANTVCEAKNVALYGYAEDILQHYKTKGVWASLSQKDPVFGLKEVDIENVVQEYQLKFESQKVKP
jgi:chromosome segregation ATPase